MAGDKDKKGRTMGWLRRNVHWLRTLLVGILVAGLVWMVFMAWPNPTFRMNAPAEHWIILIGIIGVAALLRLSLSDRALKIGGAALGENRIYDQWSNPGDTTKLADRYLSYILTTDLYDSVLPTTTTILSGATYTDRISERRELGDERSAVSVVRTMSGAAKLLAVPVLRVPKGVLVGALSVSVNGTPTRTLTHAQCRGMLLSALYVLHDAVLPTASPFMSEAIPAVLDDVPISDESLARLMSHIDAVELSAGVSEQSEALRAFTRLATTCDFVFAFVNEGCEAPTKVSISYEEKYESRVKSVGSRLRRLLGLGRRDYMTDLLNASQAPSYHLDLTGPEGMFVQNSHVVLSHHGVLSAKRASSNTLSHERAELLLIRSPRGDSSIHLYTRDMDGSPVILGQDPTRNVAVKPYFVVELRERPPGILGPTLVLALWLASVTWVVGNFYDTVFPSGTTAGSAWPAVIFGVPALVAGWLLSKLTTDVLRVISIPTFLMVAWVALDSAFVVTLAALKTTGISLGTIDLGYVHLVHPTWAFMMFLTGCNLVACLWLFIVRSFRYASTINERTGE